MGLFSRWRRRDTPETRSYFQSALDVFAPIGLVLDGDAENSIEVNEENALTASAVYAAVSVIASTIGTLPLHVRDRKTQEHATDHPVQRVLDYPNEEMTRSDAIEAFVLNLLTNGNGYLWTERNRFYDPVALYPMRSLRTWPHRVNGELLYHVQLGDGTTALSPADVVHAKNLSWDGVCGISPLRCGAGAVGLTLALDQFAAKFFTNGANIGAVLELPPMTEDTLQEFKRRFKREHQGLRNAHRMAAVPGIKVHKTGFSPHDSQAVESRKHQLREVARLYQLPPHKLGDLDDATFSNIEEQSRDFAQHTLRRWTVKIEQALEQTLLTRRDQARYSIRFNMAAIIRGTLKDQIEALSKATAGAPILTQDEARDYMGHRPVPGGNRLLSNLNQAPAEGRSLALVRTIAGNLATAEANAVARAAKKHAGEQEFRTWAEGWYPKHAETMARALAGAEIGPEELRSIADRKLADVLEARTQDGLEAFAAGLPEATAGLLAEAYQAVHESQKAA